MNGPGAGAGISLGWGLVVIGLTIVGFGLIWVFFPSFPRPGRLPGDIVIERESGQFYFPIVTCLVISVVLSALVWVIRWVKQ
jgi:hypothetical protein